MKKITLFSILLFSITLLNAQTVDEKNKMISSYNQEEIKSLEERIKKRNIEKENRVNQYINIHKIDRKTVIGNSIKEIVDVIDGYPIYLTTDNTDAAAATRTQHLNSGGRLGLSLDGQNMHIGIWDGGIVRDTHDEFDDGSGTTRVTIGDVLASVSGHGTHVGGTMIANGTFADAQGMAPEATMVSYDWTNDETEVTDEYTNNALLISNHSYGAQVFDEFDMLVLPNWYLGCYSDAAETWDDILYNAEYSLMVTSAGNNGEGTYTGGLLDGYDILAGEKNSKNNLVVANASPLILGDDILLFINSSSSQGPTDDGRIKPDITGDGTSLTSSWGTSDDAYAISTGTSMSSPNVAGSLLLLQQHYNNLNGGYMKSATIKGLVCHTADDDDDKPGPDPIFGWGILDAEHSAQVISADFNKSDAIISERSLADGQTYTYTFTNSGTDAISATICWTDPAGANQNGILNSSVPALVNDLDLRITDPNATTHEPWKLDLSDVDGKAIKGDNLVDNIENIDIATSTPGTYTITVSHKGTLAAAQNYSLIITGTNTTLNVADNALKGYNIWPNPAGDRLFFSLEETSIDPVKISVFDVQGRAFITETIKSNENRSLDTSILASGIYFVKLEQGNKIGTEKIVIE